VTPSECKIVLQVAMEVNTTTSSGSPHTPISATTVGGISLPSPPSSVHTLVVSTPSTSGNGLIPLSDRPSLHLPRVRRSLHSRMGCPTLIRNQFSPTPPYRPWVWGKGTQEPSCKGPSGVLQSHLMLSLTVGVIYLLCPPRSVVLSNNQSGPMLIIYCLE
jgi:hypothetical protein